jgi:hypothetical protein
MGAEKSSSIVRTLDLSMHQVEGGGRKRLAVGGGHHVGQRTDELRDRHPDRPCDVDDHVEGRVQLAFGVGQHGSHRHVIGGDRPVGTRRLLPCRACRQRHRQRVVVPVQQGRPEHDRLHRCVGSQRLGLGERLQPRVVARLGRRQVTEQHQPSTPGTDRGADDGRDAVEVHVGIVGRTTREQQDGVHLLQGSLEVGFVVEEPMRHLAAHPAEGVRVGQAVLSAAVGRGRLHEDAHLTPAGNQQLHGTTTDDVLDSHDHDRHTDTVASVPTGYPVSTLTLHPERDWDRTRSGVYKLTRVS